MPGAHLRIELVGGDTASRSWAQAELSRLENLGVFGSGNDFNNFDPNVKPSDLIPEESDFIRVPFRLLSATTVAAGTFRATSFPSNILRAAVGKFINVPIFPNHDQEVGNELGVIESASFVNVKITTENKTKKRKAGLKIPAGVEGVLKVDAKSNPSIARSILTGAITSVSVTVDFEWEPSHKLVDNQTLREWEWTIGDIGADGVMITRKATKIRDIFEASLVWLGADPYAKALDENGELVNIDTSHAIEQQDSFSFEANDKSCYNKVCNVEKRTYLSSGNYGAVYSFRRELGTDLRELNYKTDTKSKSTDMKKEVLALLMTMFAVESEDSITEEMVEGFGLIESDRLSKLEGFETEVVTVKEELSTEKASLAAKVVELNTANNEIADLKKDTGDIKVVKEIKETLSRIIDLGKDDEDNDIELTAANVGDTIRAWKGGSESFNTHVDEIRKETLKLYTISAGDSTDDAIVKMLEGAKVEELQALAKTYGKSAIGQFTGTCKGCGSTDITLQSSVTGNEGREEVVVSDTSSAEYLASKFGKASMNPRIHRGNK